VTKTFGKHGVPGSLLVRVAELLKFVKKSAEEHAEDFLNQEYPQWESRGDSMPSQLEAPLRDPEVTETNQLTEKIEESGLASIFDLWFATLAEAIQECLTKSDLDDVPGELSFPKVARLLDQWRERDHEQHFREVTLERRWNQNMNGFQKHWRVSLELHNCLPGGLIASQLSKFGGVLLMSATLKPFNVYKDVVGLDYFEHQHDRPVVTDTFIKKFPDENRASYIIDAPKFTSTNRGYPDEWTDVRKQYARALLSVARTPGNILVCMPSYAEAEWAADILERTSQFVGGEFSLAYASFHGWFAASLTAFLHEVLDHALDDLSHSTDRFDGRLDRFQNVLVLDTTVVTLYQSLTNSFPGSGDDHAGAKLHVVESVSTGLPTQFSVTDARTHESTQLSTGRWLSGSLLLYDQGYFDYRTMDLIDANDG